jgi:hypothetical protein
LVVDIGVWMVLVFYVCCLFNCSEDIEQLREYFMQNSIQILREM